MNYYIKKDLTEIVRAKKCSNVFFAMRQGQSVPNIKIEGYMIEHASTSTSGLITREFVRIAEFENNYNMTNIATLNLTAIGTMITSFAAADVTRPTVASTSPANNATNVAVDATVTVTFSEAIQVIAGKKATIYRKVGNWFMKVEDSTSLTVGGTGNKVLTIGHTAFTNGHVVSVVIPADTIEDTSANTNNYNTAYSFQFTVIAA